MSVMGTVVTDMTQQASFAAEYQSRGMPAQRMISPFAVRNCAKHSYFPGCIALTTPGHLDGASSKLNTEGFPGPDDVVSNGHVRAAAPHRSGRHAIDDAVEPAPMFRRAGERMR